MDEGATNMALQVGGVVLLVLGGAIFGSVVVKPSCADGDYLQVSEYESQVASTGAIKYETLTDAERRSFKAALDGGPVRVDRSQVAFSRGMSSTIAPAVTGLPSST